MRRSFRTIKARATCSTDHPETYPRTSVERHERTLIGIENVEGCPSFVQPSLWVELLCVFPPDILPFMNRDHRVKDIGTFLCDEEGVGRVRCGYLARFFDLSDVLADLFQASGVGELCTTSGYERFLTGG